MIKYSWKVCTMLLCLTIIGTTVIHLPSPLASTLPVATGSCTSAGITDQPPVQQNLISHQCAQALLIIGGVEQNPGPAQLSTEQQLQDLDGILARLSSNAPSNDVRDTMRLYDPRLDQKALERQINKASKSALVACLAYLGRSDMNEFTKDACVTAMICRIQNLLPDQCNLCKKQYCINITDTPLLSCAVCGQGTHDQCISKFLHLTELECRSFTTADAWSRINPTKLPGLHYLCMECTENTIPSEEAGKLKRKTKSTMMDDAEAATTQLQDRGVSQLLDVFTQDNTPGGEDMGTEDSTRIPQVTENVTNASDNETTTQSVLNCTHSSDRTGGDSMRNICPFYRRGICRYGVAGRLCPKDHPPACKKLTKHGNRGPNGCTLGRACDSFHPKMCPGSLSKRVCLKADCKLRHVTGTKRQKTDTPTNKSKKQETDSVSLHDHFLEAIRMMRSDIMQELDQRLAHLLKPLSPQLQPTQVVPQYTQPAMWPGNNYVMVPRGEAVSCQDTATSTNTSTSQPMMLVPVPLSH